MMKLLNRITENISYNRNKAVLFVFFIHTMILMSVVFILYFTGRDYSDYLLRDDGYYKIAARFLQGSFCAGYGPGLPFIFAPIHFFPDWLHPFVRILISQGAVFFILFFLSRITKVSLNNSQFFWGALLVVINPTFLHWSIRTSIDLYLAVMLGGFIWFIFRYMERRRLIDYSIAILFFSCGIFTKPAFLLIPFFILLFSVLKVKFRFLLFPAVSLLIFTFVLFYVNNLYIQHCRKGSVELTADTGRSIVIFQGFRLTETILKTRQFHKGSVDSYDIRNAEHEVLLDDTAFMQKYQSGSTLSHIAEYFREKPGYFAAKFLLAPVFYFSLSSRQSESYFLLIVTLSYFILSWYGLKKKYYEKTSWQNILFILFILLGYAGLHWLTHSYSRYSLPVIPFLFVWSGIVIENFLNRFQNKQKNVDLQV